MEYTEFVFSGEGKRHFTLMEDSLLVTFPGRTTLINQATGVRLTGKGLKVEFVLRELAPEYQTARRRTPAFYVGLFFFLISALTLIRGVLFRRAAGAAFRFDSFELIPLAIIMGSISFLILLFSWRKLESAIFLNATGDDAVSITRSGPDRRQFATFVEELSRRIRQAQSEPSDELLRPDIEQSGGVDAGADACAESERRRRNRM